MPGPRLFLTIAANGEQIMSHLVKSRVNDFVIHRENQNRLEIFFQQRFQFRRRFAVYVPFDAARAGVTLGFQSWCPDHKHAVRLQVGDDIIQKRFFMLRVYMLNNVNRISGAV